MPSRRLLIESRPLAEIRSDPRNPRHHPPAQLRSLVRSIEEFGWTVPILVDGDGLVIAGNARLTAARQLRRETVPVVVIDDLPPAARRACQLADNRIPLGAEWDEALLAEVLDELSQADLDIAVTGFSDDELAALLEEAPADAQDQLDTAPPLPANPVTKPGDLWQLGAHRLICGDSTDPDTVARLVTGKQDAADLVFTDPPYGMTYGGGRAQRRADLVFTDPPYGMAFGAGKEAGSTAKGATVKAHGEILGDDLEGAALIDLVAGALAAALASARDRCPVYVCLTWRTYSEFETALARAGLAVASCIVWDKGSIGLGQQHYRPRHEFIFYCAARRGLAGGPAQPKSSAHFYGGRTEGDVWTFSRGNTEAYVHPTQKPVALIERAIRNSSLPGDVVLDVFGGSGSTLIACERQGRRARLVELDPKYCDAICVRWQDLTGCAARRSRDAALFDDLLGKEALGHDDSRRAD